MSHQDTSTKAMEREAAMMDRSQNFVWGRKTRSLAAERDALAAQLAEAQAEVKACHKENHLKADFIEATMNDCAAQDQTIHELKAEITRLQSGAVEVKPLEWAEAGREFEALCVCGDYWVSFDDETGHWYASLETHDPDPIIVDPGDVPNINDAQAAAQADYERRILSAIETTSADE